MPRFVFRLETVLKQRRWEEQQRLHELAVRQAHNQKIEQQLRHLEKQVGEANDDMRANRLTGPIDLSFLAAHRRFLAAMQRGAVELMQRLTLGNRQVAEAQAVVTEAAKRRKVLEKLQEKQFERWRAEQDRREVAQLDEVGTQRAYQDLMQEAEGST
jgi:flagellar FliJ protein